jgi:hypothetical protein
MKKKRPPSLTHDPPRSTTVSYPHRAHLPCRTYRISARRMLGRSIGEADTHCLRAVLRLTFPPAR